MYVDEYGNEVGQGYEIVTEVLAHNKCAIAGGFISPEHAPKVVANTWEW